MNHHEEDMREDTMAAAEQVVAIQAPGGAASQWVQARVAPDEETVILRPPFSRCTNSDERVRASAK